MPMKIRLFAFLLLVVSCSSDDDNGYQSRLRELLMEDMSFTCEGGTQEQEYRHEDLSIYKVSNKESWCLPSLDINHSKLVVTVKANTTYDARTDTVTLTDTIAKISRYITVKQARNTGLFLDKTYFEASMYGDTVSTKLKSNVSFEVQIPDTCDWVTMGRTNKTRGLDSTTLTFYVKENKTYKDREATVTVVNTDEKLTDKLKIYQPFNTVFKADSTNFEVDMYGDTITVNLETNISYDVTIPETCSWITRKNSSARAGARALTRGVDTKTLTFYIKENKTYHGRDGVVTLSNSDAGASIEIKIHQPFNTVFSPEKKYYEASQYGDTVSIKMSSNVRYDVTIPEGCDWITRAATRKTRGVESSSIFLKVAENKTYKEREAVLKVSNEDAGVSASITIYQPFNTVFSTDSTSFEVPMDGATFTVRLRHNVGYDVSIPGDCAWISKVTGSRKGGAGARGSRSTRSTRSTSGIDTTAIVFRATENTSEQERGATITFSHKDAGAEARIYVHQPFTTTFNVDSTSFEVGTGGGTKTVNVESNISYTVSIPSDCKWISLAGRQGVRETGRQGTRGVNTRAKTRGTKTEAILFKVSENTTGKERSATVTIGNSRVGVSKAISFKQKFEATFEVDTTTVEADEQSGTFGINVVANVGVSVQPLASWLTKGDKTDTGDGYWTQKIKVSKFTGKAPKREGKVKFLYAAGNQTKTVTVTQKRTLYVSLSDTTLTESGQKLNLSGLLTNTDSRPLTWKSSNKSVATVNGSGTVTAVANGTAVITVKSSDDGGKYSDAVNITVEIPEPPSEGTGGSSGGSGGESSGGSSGDSSGGSGGSSSGGSGGSSSGGSSGDSSGGSGGSSSGGSSGDSSGGSSGDSSGGSSGDSSGGSSSDSSGGSGGDSSGGTSGDSSGGSTDNPSGGSGDSSSGGNTENASGGSTENPSDGSAENASRARKRVRVRR